MKLFEISEQMYEGAESGFLDRLGSSQ